MGQVERARDRDKCMVGVVGSRVGKRSGGNTVCQVGAKRITRGG